MPLKLGRNQDPCSGNPQASGQDAAFEPDEPDELDEEDEDDEDDEELDDEERESVR
jgi:hypothetical protein